jgi:putative oxidoreductase
MDKWNTRQGPLVARIFLAVIFLLSGLTKLFNVHEVTGYLLSAGVTPAGVFLVLAILIEIVGGVSLLFGIWTRAGATLLAVYLVPVTLAFHSFWNFTGMEQQQQFIEFLKNLAIMGGLCALTALGAGELSVDARYPNLHRRLAHPLQRHAAH